MNTRKLLIPIAVLVVAAMIGLGAGLWSRQQGRDAENPYAHIGGDFTLASKTGPVSLSAFSGKVVLLFFGYTHCPDVCPTELAKMRAAFDDLTQREAEQVFGIFVSVDTERDTPEKVSDYAAFFHERIIGLTGSAADISAVAKRYFALYQKATSDNGVLDYTMDHSATIYLIGRDGLVQGLMQRPTVEEMVQAIRDALSD